MRAGTRIVATTDGAGTTRLTDLRSAAPVAVRAGPQGVFLVGSAGGPLGGDEVTLEVVVGDGAVLVLRTSAASVALAGSTSDASRLDVDVQVGRSAQLWWLPEPSVSTRGSRRCSSTVVRCQPGSFVAWREEIVLGRHDEPSGSFSSRFELEVGERAVLRQELRGGPDAPGATGPGIAGPARAIGSVVVVDPRWQHSPPPTSVLGPRAAILGLPGPAVQVSAVADGATSLRTILDAGLAELGVGEPSDTRQGRR